MKKQYDYMVVGAGFAGSILAERLASQLNKKILVVEKRSHIAGNAYDEYDEHGILVHKYGPHIFHTNSKVVFNYLSKFTGWFPYEHKVLAYLEGNFYPIPINRLTINMLYELELTLDSEVQLFYERVREKRYPILNSEDIIVNQIGHDLFEKFFKNYTIKQWHHEPKELSPSVCGRIPVRINDDCRYFTDKYQYMPEEGYTKMFEKMLNNRNIEILLNTDYKKIIDDTAFKKIIYTGPIDYFFDYKFGKLPYRSIRFEFENYKQERYQERAQINYVGSEPYTRVIEHKQLTGQKAASTTISREYPMLNGEEFYPIPSEENRNLYMRYRAEAKKYSSVIFCGRLAEYQYYNMDQVTANSLKVFKSIANG
ncbi:MAG: UDP-galactopyranose mutase [Ignavibacteriaceae bacterium]